MKKREFKILIGFTCLLPSIACGGAPRESGASQGSSAEGNNGSSGALRGGESANGAGSQAPLAGADLATRGDGLLLPGERIYASASVYGLPAGTASSITLNDERTGKPKWAFGFVSSGSCDLEVADVSTGSSALSTKVFTLALFQKRLSGIADFTSALNDSNKLASLKIGSYAIHVDLAESLANMGVVTPDLPLWDTKYNNQLSIDWANGACSFAMTANGFVFYVQKDGTDTAIWSSDSDSKVIFKHYLNPDGSPYLNPIGCLVKRPPAGDAVLKITSAGKVEVASRSHFLDVAWSNVGDGFQCLASQIDSRLPRTAN